MQRLVEILRNLTVLYAEDDSAIRANTAKTLELFFGRVLVAEDGADALRFFKQEKVDVALLDYVMPCVDGHEVAKEIRQSHPHMPIIICSGFTDKEKLLNAIRLGVIQYIEKPMKYETLVEVLKQAVVKLQEKNLLTFAVDAHLQYDIANQCVYVKEKKVELTSGEVSVLEMLLRHQGRLVSKEQLQEALKEPSMSENALRNMVYRLRKKLETEHIVTVKEMGYLLKTAKGCSHGY